MKISNRNELITYKKSLTSDNISLYGVTLGNYTELGGIPFRKFDKISKSYLYSGDDKFPYPSRYANYVVFTSEREAWKHLYSIFLEKEEKLNEKIAEFEKDKLFFKNAIENNPHMFA